jgi:hypothetical protein
MSQKTIRSAETCSADVGDAITLKVTRYTSATHELGTSGRGCNSSPRIELSGQECGVNTSRGNKGVQVLINAHLTAA